MAVGRISGPLLKANLLRNGVDLAFETDLLYLDVNNSRIGVNNAAPAYDLDVTGTTRTTNLEVTNELDIGAFTISGNTILSNTPTMSFLPAAGDVTVYQSRLSVDDLLLEGNSIKTTNSNANLEFKPNGTGTVDIYSNTNIYGNLNATGNISVDGNVTIKGNIVIGDQNTDTITINAGITSNILPEFSGQFDLGSAALQWRNIFADRAVLSDIEIFDNVIRTTVSNANLELRANGTGGIRLEKIQINENIISTWDTNENIVLQPQGTGRVIINSTTALQLPVGTDAERPSPATVGGMRYNTDRNRYEGFDGTNWFNLVGVEDVDGNTKITAELTPGANDNIIRFYANNVITADIDSTRLRANRLDVDSVSIDNNTITSLTSGTNLQLSSNGTGVVRIENFDFKNNTITNRVSGAITLLDNTGTGYFKFTGTNGFVIPKGISSERPTAYAEVGMMRYNLDSLAVEVWDGIQWASPAGAGGAINITTAQDIALVTILTLG